MQASLEELREEQCSYLKEYKEANTTKLSKDKLTLSFERQQLDRALGHLHLDREHLKKSETELEEGIELRTREFQMKKDELLVNRLEIQVRLRKPRAVLACVAEGLISALLVSILSEQWILEKKI